MFSICIPEAFTKREELYICKEIADGNAYKDYTEDDIEVGDDSGW